MKANLERENITEGEQWMAIGCLGTWREAVETVLFGRSCSSGCSYIAPNYRKSRKAREYCIL